MTAPSRFDHLREEKMTAVHHTAQVDADDPLPVVERRVYEQATEPDARVVTEHIGRRTGSGRAAGRGTDGGLNAVLLGAARTGEQVRAQPANQGPRLPADTLAVAALNDTSTDEITLARPGLHPKIESSLAAAGRRAGL